MMDSVISARGGKFCFTSFSFPCDSPGVVLTVARLLAFVRGDGASAASLDQRPHQRQRPNTFQVPLEKL